MSGRDNGIEPSGSDVLIEDAVSSEIDDFTDEIRFFEEISVDSIFGNFRIQDVVNHRISEIIIEMFVQ